MAAALTVVIGTLDRPASLARVLRDLLRQDVGTSAFDVVVVDNGARGQVRPVVDAAGCAAQGLAVRVVDEPRLGISVARNRGLREVTTPIVAFTDDDVVIPPGWIGAIRTAVARDTDAVAWAGRIELVGASLPTWISRRGRRFLSALELGPERRDLTWPLTPVGANMVIRRDSVAGLGGFSEGLGRRGVSLRSNEERELFFRLYRMGRRVVYDPAVCVGHAVDGERLRASWMVRRAWAQGWSNAELERMHASRPRLAWLGAAAASLRQAVGGKRAVWARLRDGRPRARVLINEGMRMATEVGYGGRCLQVALRAGVEPSS